MSSISFGIYGPNATPSYELFELDMTSIENNKDHFFQIISHTEKGNLKIEGNESFSKVVKFPLGENWVCSNKSGSQFLLI